MKRISIVMVLLAAALASAQYSASATCTQVCSYSGEDIYNAGGKSTSRVGNNGLYSMLINFDLTGLTLTERCTLYLTQVPANNGTDYTDELFNTQVSTVAGTWNSGASNEDPEEGAACFLYRSYSASSPVYWVDGDNSSTLNSVSGGQGGSHVNATDVFINTVASGLPSFAALDAALIQDLAGGVCSGIRVARAPGQAGEMKFSTNGVMLSWDPAADPISAERRMTLSADQIYHSPNPCRSGAAFFLGRDFSRGLVSIFDVRGGLVNRVSGDNGRAVWNGTDLRGVSVADGVYFYTVEQGGKTEIRSLTVIR